MTNQIQTSKVSVNVMQKSMIKVKHTTTITATLMMRVIVVMTFGRIFYLRNFRKIFQHHAYQSQNKRRLECRK